MYLVDNEVMEFALGNLDGVHLYAVLHPYMSVVRVEHVDEDFQRHIVVPSINIEEAKRHEVYSRDHDSYVTVKVNRDLGVLEAYYPYKLQSQREI